MQNRTNQMWPRIDIGYGQLCDGRWFNAEKILAAPANPPGTNATLTMREGFGFYLEGERYVLYSGNVKNTGNYTIVRISQRACAQSYSGYKRGMHVSIVCMSEHLFAGMPADKSC